MFPFDDVIMNPVLASDTWAQYAIGATITCTGPLSIGRKMPPDTNAHQQEQSSEIALKKYYFAKLLRKPILWLLVTAPDMRTIFPILETPAAEYIL